MTYKIKKNRHPSSGPFKLEIFLTNRCNMNCSYCSSRYMIRKKEAKTLTFDQLKRAVDVISLQSRDKYIQDKFNGQVKIRFTGGEPLLEFELLKRAINHMRTKEPDFEIEVVTNGILLTKNMMDFFARNNVEICLRLNGDKRVSDLHGKSRNSKKESVFEVAIDNLKKGLLNERGMDHLYIRTTFNSQTIDRLPDVVKFLRHDIGFKELEIELQPYEIWSRAGINRLRNALRNLKSRFLPTLEHEKDIKNIEPAFREALFGHFKETDYNKFVTDLTLFHDGYFYPIDFVVKPPLERKYIVGDLKHGIDFKRIKTIASSPMFTEISRKCEYKSGPLPPVGRYYWGVVNKFTPDRLNKLLKNTSQVNRVFSEEMDRYVKLHGVNKEIRSFRLML